MTSKQPSADDYDTLANEDGQVHVVPHDSEHVLSSECHCNPGRATERGRPVWLHFTRSSVR